MGYIRNYEQAVRRFTQNAPCEKEELQPIPTFDSRSMRMRWSKFPYAIGLCPSVRGHFSVSYIYSDSGFGWVLACRTRQAFARQAHEFIAAL
jgi:hypothetical protein